MCEVGRVGRADRYGSRLCASVSSVKRKEVKIVGRGLGMVVVGEEVGGGERGGIMFCTVTFREGKSMLWCETCRRHLSDKIQRNNVH